MTVYWLDPGPGATWIGWRVTTRPYRETRVVVRDLDALPLGARVYIGGHRWAPCRIFLDTPRGAA